MSEIAKVQCLNKCSVSAEGPRSWSTQRFRFLGPHRGLTKQNHDILPSSVQLHIKKHTRFFYLHLITIQVPRHLILVATTDMATPPNSSVQMEINPTSFF